MLGLSLGKIIFTIFVIVLVWKGFALVNRLQRERRGQVGDTGRSRPARRHARGETVDLVVCSRCGSYYDPSAGCRCGDPGVRSS